MESSSSDVQVETSATFASSNDDEKLDITMSADELAEHFQLELKVAAVTENGNTSDIIESVRIGDRIRISLQKNTTRLQLTNDQTTSAYK